MTLFLLMRQIFLKVAEDSGVDSVELSGEIYNVLNTANANENKNKNQIQALRKLLSKDKQVYIGVFVDGVVPTRTRRRHAFGDHQSCLKPFTEDDFDFNDSEGDPGRI